ncbi:hypothetical protein L0244_07505 [bacterium]|nr:hypothetical protein [bacterium]
MKQHQLSKLGYVVALVLVVAMMITTVIFVGCEKSHDPTSPMSSTTPDGSRSLGKLLLPSQDPENPYHI